MAEVKSAVWHVHFGCWKVKAGGGDGPDGGSSGTSSSLCTGDIGTFGSAYTGWLGIGAGPVVGGAPEGGCPEGWSVSMSSLSGPGSGLFVVALVLRRCLLELTGLLHWRCRIDLSSCCVST